nr:hypothetical protein [Opitutaceae bacterium]
MLRPTSAVFVFCALLSAARPSTGPLHLLDAHDLALPAFPLATASSAATIVLPPDAASVVRIAAADFAADVERVTGIRPQILDTPLPSDSGPRVVVQLDPALAGHWEAFRLSATADTLLV